MGSAQEPKQPGVPSVGELSRSGACSWRRMLASLAPLLLLLAGAGCKESSSDKRRTSEESGPPAGCTKDSDCKGSRVCVKGACEEPVPAGTTASPGSQTSPTQAVPIATTPVEPVPPPTPPPAPPAPTCLACSSQEDFDRALKAGSKCCPVTACKADKDCTAGRVCCKIPDGQLCADASRCTGVNRVQQPKKAPSPDERCRRICPGNPVELTHCYCACMGQCPPG